MDTGSSRQIQNCMKKKKRKIVDYLGRLLRRHDSRTSTPAEQEALGTWQPKVELPPLDKEEKELLDLYSRLTWMQLAKRLHLQDSDTQVRPARSWGRHWQKVAAMLALAVCLGGGMWLATSRQSARQTARLEQQVRRSWESAPRGRLRLDLPDGSVVTLNAGSRLELAEALYNKEKREVWLSGEAFFEVAPDPHKPFIVHAGALQTRVHGTSFNVKAYPSLEEQVVTVRDGKVEVSQGRHSLALLTADRQVCYDTVSGKAEVSEVDGEGAAGWLYGNLVLNGATPQELQLRFEQWYGMRLRLEGGALAGRHVLGYFAPGHTAPQVLDALCAIYPIHYRIDKENKEITIYSND